VSKKQRLMQIPLGPRISLVLVHDLEERTYSIVFAEKTGRHSERKQAMLQADEAMKAGRFLCGIDEMKIMAEMNDEEPTKP